MRIRYDPAKNERNMMERGLSFEQVREFEFETAVIRINEHMDYQEARYVALGFLQGRLHVLCFVEEPDGICVISFRKAHSREVNRYAKVQPAD